MKQPLPRWSRRSCEHPRPDLFRTGGGLVIREVCPSCGAELSAVMFDSVDEALDALRDAVSVASERAPAVQPVREPVKEPVGEPPRAMIWEPVAHPDPYGATIPALALEMRPVLPWPRTGNHE
jgi:hypothetical protein